MNLAQVRAVDAFMTQLIREYRNGAFIGFDFLKRVTHNKAGGKLLVPGDEQFSLVDIVRAPGGTIKEFMLSHSDETFAMLGKALQCVVPFEWMREGENLPGEDLKTRAVNTTMRIVALATELQQATLLRNPGSYAVENVLNVTAAEDKWTHANSDPSEQILDIQETARKGSGLRPNVIGLSPSAAYAARKNVKVRANFAGTDKATRLPSLADLAELWQVERVVIGDGIYKDSKGKRSDIWGNDVIMAYVPENPLGMEDAGFGATLTMDGHPKVLEGKFNDDILSWKYPVLLEDTAVILNKSAGALLKNVV